MTEMRHQLKSLAMACSIALTSASCGNDSTSIASLQNAAEEPKVTIPDGSVFLVSKRLVARGFRQSFEESDDFRDQILGRSVQGSRTVTGEVRATLVPNPDRAVIRVHARGQLSSRSVTFHGHRQIHSTGSGTARLTKDVSMNPTGVLLSRSKATSDFRSQIQCAANVVFPGIVCRQAEAQKPAADRQANGKWREQFRSTIDQEMNRQLHPAHQRYQDHIYRPLIESNRFQGEFAYRSTPHYVVQSIQFAEADLSTQPTFQAGLDFGLRLHEKTLSEIFRARLVGNQVSAKEFSEQWQEAFGAKETESESDEAEDDEDILIKFAQDTQPVEMRFQQDHVAARIRAAGFIRVVGDRQIKYPAMNITLYYQLEEKEGQLHLKQARPTEIVPPGFKEGDELSFKQKATKSLIEKKLTKSLTVEKAFPPLVLPEAWQDFGELSVQRAEARDGWLMVTWLRSESP